MPEGRVRVYHIGNLVAIIGRIFRRAGLPHMRARSYFPDFRSKDSIRQMEDAIVIFPFFPRDPRYRTLVSLLERPSAVPSSVHGKSPTGPRHGRAWFSPMMEHYNRRRSDCVA